MNNMSLENTLPYGEFKKRYNIELNEQQEKALLAVDGAHALLAVPGSGKTTVLVARLGYMMICKGISPRNVLAITYNKAAAAEMRERFSAKFGARLCPEFRTINSLALKIYTEYCRSAEHRVWVL